MQIVLPRRLGPQQPSGPLELNRAHPLAQNLQHFIIFRDGLGFDVATNTEAPAGAGGSVVEVSANGRGRRFNKAGTGQYILNSAWTAGVGRFNGCFAIGWVPGNIGAHGFIATMRAGGSGSRFYIARESNGLSSWGFHGDGTIATGPLWGVDQYAVSALEWEDGRNAQYFQGELIRAGTETPSGAPSSAAIGTLSNSPGTASFQSNGAAEWYAVWSEPIREELHAELARNPYSVLRPAAKRVLYFDSTAGTGGGVNGNASAGFSAAVVVPPDGGAGAGGSAAVALTALSVSAPEAVGAGGTAGAVTAFGGFVACACTAPAGVGAGASSGSASAGFAQVLVLPPSVLLPVQELDPESLLEELMRTSQYVVASDGVRLVLGNLAQTRAYTGGKLRHAEVQYRGRVYRQSYTYVGDDLTGISRWERQP